MTDATTPPAPQSAGGDSFWTGFGAAIFLDAGIPFMLGVAAALVNGVAAAFQLGNIIPFSLGTLSGALAFAVVFGIGLVQWLWLTPLSIHAKRQGRIQYCLGMRTAGWIVFLLNASCYGIVFRGGRGSIF